MILRTIFIIMAALFTDNLATQLIDLRVEFDRDQLIFGQTLKVYIEVIPRLSIQKLKLDLKLNSLLNFTVDDSNLNCSSKCEEITALHDPTGNYQSLTLLNDAQLMQSGFMLRTTISLLNMEATPSSTFDQTLIVNVSFTDFNGSVDFTVDMRNFTLKPVKVVLSLDTVAYEIHKISEIILRSKNQSNEMIFMLSKPWRKMMTVQIHMHDTCMEIFCIHETYCKSSRILDFVLEPETLYANFTISFNVKNQQCHDLLQIHIKVAYDNSAVDIARINFRQPVANVDCTVRMVSSKKLSFEADDTVEYEAIFYHSPNSTSDAMILYAGLDVNSSTGLTVDRYATLFSDTSESLFDYTDGLRPGTLLKNESIAVKFRVKLDSTVALGSLYSSSFIYEFETMFEVVQDQKCLPRVCKNGGFCREFHGVPVCTCAAGYTGDACELKTCPNNWIFVPLNQACYFVDSMNRSYFDAQNQCLSIGGAIAGIDSYSDFISLNILNKKYNFSHGLWLGYNTFLQEEANQESRSTWFHVEYVSGHAVPNKQDCSSFSPQSRSRVIKEPCHELKPYICIDKRNYVKSRLKTVPLILQISQPKVVATFSSSNDDQPFISTVEIFLPKDFEPRDVNISILEGCLVLPSGIYSGNLKNITCGSYLWKNSHRLPTMASSGGIDPVVYNATFANNNNLNRIKLKLYFTCGNESQLVSEQYFRSSSSPQLELVKFVTVDPQDKRLKIVANIKHEIDSSETAYNIRYEDDLTNLKVQSIADQCTIKKSNNRLCYSKDKLRTNESLSFSYDVSADRNLTFDPFYFNSILNYSSLKPGVLHSDENSRRRTSIEISTCIVRNEDIIINEIKIDKRSLLILFGLTFVVSGFTIVSALGMFVKFCRTTKDSKAENDALDRSSQSGRPNDDIAGNTNFEDQCAQGCSSIMTILRESVNNRHDTFTSMDLQDIKSIEVKVEYDKMRILPRFISMWLNNLNISQETVDKILIGVENSILKFMIEAKKEKRKIKDYVKNYFAFEFLKDQRLRSLEDQVEFTTRKFIRRKMWHETWTKIHLILDETNIHQGEHLCSKFFQLFVPIQNQLAMQLIRRFLIRRLSVIQLDVHRSILHAIKDTAMEYCRKGLENHEKVHSHIQNAFDSSLSELDNEAQLLDNIMQKEVIENQDVEIYNFYSTFENLDTKPDEWLSKINEIKLKSVIKINEREIQLAEQYFNIVEKSINTFIEKCSSLSLAFGEGSLKNLKAALTLKMMQMKEEMKIRHDFDQELKKLGEELENRDHTAAQCARQAISLSQDEHSNLETLVCCENDLSAVVSYAAMKFNCQMIDSFDQAQQKSALSMGHWQDYGISYLRHTLVKQQTSKVDQLSQLKFDTWCLETLISCLISYISRNKLTTESILQKVQDDHRVEFNFLYNHLLNKKHEEENYEEKELKKNHAHRANDLDHEINDLKNRSDLNEKLLAECEKRKEVQNFVLEQEINDMKRLCKLRMEKRLIEEVHEGVEKAAQLKVLSYSINPNRSEIPVFCA